MMLTGLLAVVTALAGCIPTRSGETPGEREPSFVKGQNLLARLDYPGAIHAFERTLRVQPDFAPAHFELGFLHKKNSADLAAAIYHFERFLRLDPRSDKAAIVRQHVDDCKMDLARLFLIPPVAPSLQKEMTKLKEQVKSLELENLTLRQQLQAAAVTAPPAETASSTPEPVAPPPPVVAVAGVRPASAPPAAQPTATAAAAEPRWHTVRDGEYPARIARLYGLKLETLLKANPGLDPRRMKIGQEVIIPEAGP